MPTISSACAAVGGAAGNEAELSKTYPSAAISRKLFRYRPSISPLARKCRSSYHVEVAETGCYRNSSDIGDRTQRPVGGSSPRRASQHGNAEPDHSSVSRGGACPATFGWAGDDRQKCPGQLGNRHLVE